MKRIATLAVLVLILILAGSTLVATGTQSAYATNESSYLYGKMFGEGQWEDCTATPNSETGDSPGCVNGSGACTSPTFTDVKNETTGMYDPVPHYDVMTNKTACIDGYVHAWNHVCDKAKARENNVDCPTTFEKEAEDHSITTINT